MQNFLNKVFNLAKKNIMFILLGVLGLQFLGLIFDTIVSAGYGEAGFMLSTIFYGFISLALFGLMLFAWLKKRTEWFKVFATIFFSHYFLYSFYYLADLFSFFGVGAVSTIYTIIEIIYNLAIIVISIMVVIDYLNKTEKFAKIINWIMAGMVCAVALMFIFGIIAVCVGEFSWNHILDPIIEFAILAFFAGLYNFNRELPVEEKPVKEEKIEENAESEEKTEEVKEEPVPAEEKVEETKAEQPEEKVEEPKEEVKPTKAKKEKKEKKAKKEKPSKEKAEEPAKEEPKEETKEEGKEEPIPVEEKVAEPVAEEVKEEPKEEIKEEPKEEGLNYLPIACPKCGERKTVKESESLAVCKNCGAKLKIAKKK